MGKKVGFITFHRAGLAERPWRRRCGLREREFGHGVRAVLSGRKGKRRRRKKLDSFPRPPLSVTLYPSRLSNLKQHRPSSCQILVQEKKV